MSLPFLNKEFNFDLSNELIEKLIDIFHKEGYEFTETNQVHKFHWPDVVLTDKKKDNHLINDNLGTYSFVSAINGKQESEGQVFIYYDAIFGVAKNYIESNPLSDLNESEVFEAITSIVLVHEFVHWIMHQKIGFNPFKYDSDDSKNFHEGFAELFTWNIVEDYSFLKALFISLLPSDKESPYLKYQELKDPISGNLISINDAIDILKWNIKLGKQSFETSKNLINIIKLKDKEQLNDVDSEYWFEYLKNSNVYKNLETYKYDELYKKLPSNKQEALKNKKLINKFKL